MLLGLILTLFVGLLWGVVGILVSRLATRHEPALPFLAAGYSAAAIGAGLLVVKWSVLLQGLPARWPELLLWVGGAGICSAGFQLALQPAFRRGSHAATWACAQSALIAPFLAGIFIWGDHVGLSGWVGVSLVIVALPAVAGGAWGHSRPGWASWMLLTWGLIAAQQTAASVSSRWPGWHDDARIRPALTCLTTAIVLQAAARWRNLASSATASAASRRSWWALVLLYSACLVAAFVCLFIALDRLSAVGSASLVYPLAVGTCISSMVLWRLLRSRERLHALAVVGLIILVLGVILLGFAAH